MGLDFSHRVIFGDNLPVLRRLPSGAVDLIYIDPPFNTGKTQTRTQLRTERSPDGDRVGFQGQRYRSVRIGTQSFDDQFDDYLAFLAPRLREAHRVLAQHGSLYFHIDYREVHYCKVLLDQVFGRGNFLNEIIWAYDYGGRPKRRWPPKHDNILVYVKDTKRYVFNAEEVERIPYMAPGLVGKEKAERGKLPTDVWWHTIVSPTGKEKTGYPHFMQTMLDITHEGGSTFTDPFLVDFFAGSGTTGAAALELGRRFLLIDNNPQAIQVMKERFRDQPVEFVDEVHED